MHGSSCHLHPRHANATFTANLYSQVAGDMIEWWMMKCVVKTSLCPLICNYQHHVHRSSNHTFYRAAEYNLDVGGSL